MFPDSSFIYIYFYKYKLCCVQCHTMISLKVAIAVGCLSQPKASIEKALYPLCDTHPYPSNLKMFCSWQARFPDSAFVMYFCWSTFPRKQIKTKPKKHFVFFPLLSNHLWLINWFYSSCSSAKKKQMFLFLFWASMALTREH